MEEVEDVEEERRLIRGGEGGAPNGGRPSFTGSSSWGRRDRRRVVEELVASLDGEGEGEGEGERGAGTGGAGRCFFFALAFLDLGVGGDGDGRRDLRLGTGALEERGTRQYCW